MPEWSEGKRRQAVAALSGDEFRRIGHGLVDEIAAFLDGIGDRSVTPWPTPAGVRELLPQGGLPETGAPADTLLAEATRLLIDASLHTGHPRFLAYITASSAPIDMLADLLAAAVNPNCGAWQLSPVASEIERQTVRWIAELIGFPATCGGLFVSGGNAANFTCYLAARAAVLRADDARGAAEEEEPRRRAGDGTDTRPLVVYATPETHTWIQKAIGLFGRGSERLRSIPTGREAQAADADALRTMIREDRAAGVRPFLAVASAGTVGTGAIDPIAAIADACRDEGVWLHVDGAFGAPAAALPEAPADLHALGRADSVAVDPHKWLYAPLEAGCALVRDDATLLAAFSHKPPYYRFDSLEEADPQTNFYERGLQNSRGFRALKVWLGMRHAGREGIVTMIRDDCALAERIYERCLEHPELEAVTLGLSIATFRYVPPALADANLPPDAAARYLDTVNESLLARLQASGELFVSNAVVGGRFVLRACVCNFRTDWPDADAVPQIVALHGRTLAAELPPPSNPEPPRGGPR